MKLRNMLTGCAMLAGLATYASAIPAASAATLQSPDSDALVAGYQVIRFDLKECQALSVKSTPTANGTGSVSPEIVKVAAKICGDAKANKPKLEALAKANNFTLPEKLPYTLTARYSALIRNQNGDMGTAYLNDQISSHQDALAIFQEEAANGTNADIKAAFTAVIPTVQSNLTLLQTTLAKH